jgi:hypothetical protein
MEYLISYSVMTRNGWLHGDGFIGSSEPIRTREDVEVVRARLGSEVEKTVGEGMLISTHLTITNIINLENL